MVEKIPLPKIKRSRLRGMSVLKVRSMQRKENCEYVPEKFWHLLIHVLILHQDMVEGDGVEDKEMLILNQIVNSRVVVDEAKGTPKNP
jgi:hypothetical protein